MPCQNIHNPSAISYSRMTMNPFGFNIKLKKQQEGFFKYPPWLSPETMQRWVFKRMKTYRRSTVRQNGEILQAVYLLMY